MTEVQTRGNPGGGRELIQAGGGRKAGAHDPGNLEPSEVVDQKKIIKKVYEMILASSTCTLQAGLCVGTMIEIPRACIRADEFAKECQFFSFGTKRPDPDGLSASPGTTSAGPAQLP